MDNVTHALAGALLAAAACELREKQQPDPPRGFRRAAFIAGIVTAELPDVDLAYAGSPMGMGNLGYLLQHRGHTHTVLFALVGAAFTWLLVLAFQRALRRPTESRAILMLCVAGTLSHIALDYTNSYGVHPFWPVDRRWYYGDAVFIVEPWFWIVALPPLFLVARRGIWRALCVVLLAVILVASWRVSMVGLPVALALTVGALAWSVIARLTRPRARVASALVAWVALELLFFVGSGVARRAVRAQVGPSYLDVALSPSPGNPFCLSALLLRVDGDVYSASRASVAPYPAILAQSTCQASVASRAAQRDTTSAESARGADRSIRWEDRWSAQVSELRALAASNCTAAAALRFIRIPKWERSTDATLIISDLRFGDGAGNFATVHIPPGAACPHLVPNWEFPRHDLLSGGP